MAGTNYSPIQLYYSTTASAAPAAGNLVSGELAINITDGKLYYKDNAGTVQLLSTSTTANGTANGVLYLNGSKVATSGSALTFDGTNFANTAGNIQSGTNVRVGVGINTGQIYFNNTDVGVWRGAANSLSTGAYLNLGGYDGIAFATSAAGIGSQSEGMRLTSTGLGIGTSSPLVTFDVKGATDTHVGITASAEDEAIIIAYNDSGIRTPNLSYGAASHKFLINTTLAATLDSSGNLGLGVTPSGHLPAGYGGPILQVGGRASILGSATTSAYTNNTYYAAGYFRYIGNDEATMLEQIDGAFKFYTAASGTAGDAITFSQVMTLDASGNLAIGQTSASRTLDVKGYVSSTDGTTRTEIVNGGGVGYFGTSTNHPLAFQTNNTERARIDSSGNLLVGTTTAGAGLGYATRLAVDGGASEASVFKTSAGTGAYCSRMWNSATTGNNVFVNFQTEAGGTDRGSITYNRAGGLTVYNTTSDYRAKDIYGPVIDSGTLIDSVPVYMGKMKGATQERPMFIAHETPAYAHTGEKDAVDADGNPVYQQMDASALIPVMWAEIQSLRKRLADAGIA